MADPESLLTSPAFVEVLRALGLTNLDADAFQMLEDARQQVMIGEMSVDEYDALKASVEVQLKQAAIELANLHAPPRPAASAAATASSSAAAQPQSSGVGGAGASAVRTLGSYVSGLTKAATAPEGEKPILESELFKAPISQQFANIGQKTFKKRYVVLYKNCLCYYANKGDLVPKGRVDLSPDFFIQDSNAHLHGFVISDMNVTLTLAAESAELKGYWMHMVANVIRKLKERAAEDHHVVLPTHSTDDLKDIYEQKLEEYKKAKANRRKSFFFRKKKEQEDEMIKKAGEVAVKQTYEELKALEQKRQKELEELHAKLQDAEGEVQKFKSEADVERERAEREAARAEDERRRREEAEARAGMSMEQWQAEARARELELQRERDEIRALLEKSNQKRRQTMMPGAGGASSEEIERLERERKALQAKLDALSKALDLDMGGLEWDGTLDDAEAKMKALVPKLCSEDEKEAREAQVQFDQWDKIIRNHADYKKREEEKWIKWEEDQKDANQKALQEMKKIVPFEVTTGVDMEFLTKRGLSNPVAQRVMKTKIFLFLYMDKNTIAKTHIADLSTRYVIQGLDIIEMRAIYTCLPEEFQLDADGKKAIWRETYRAKLHQMTQKEKDGTISKNDARNPAYRPPEAAKPGGGGGPAAMGGPRGPNPMAGALAGLFAGRGAPPGGGGAPPANPVAAMLAGRGAPAGAPPVNPIAAMLAARGPPRGPPAAESEAADAKPANPVAALFAGRGGPGGLPPPPQRVVEASAEATAPATPAKRESVAATPPPKRESIAAAPRPAATSTSGAATPSPPPKKESVATPPPKRESVAAAPRPAATSTSGAATSSSPPRAASGSTAGAASPSPPRAAAGSVAASPAPGRPASESTSSPTTRQASGMSLSGSAKSNALAARFEQAQKEKVELAKKRASKAIDLGYSFNAPGSGGAGGGDAAGGSLLSKDAQALLDKMRQGGGDGNFNGEVKTYDFLGAVEERQKKAAWVDEGIVKVAEIIKTHGKKDAKEGGVATMKFGELYKKFGEGSDMLVGILMRGKKQKKVKYAGDML